MKGIKISTFVIFGFAVLSGVALLHTSGRVQQAEEQLAHIQAEIQKEEEMTRVLTAEWEYLNRPERLEQLAEEFLDLVAPAPDALAGAAMMDAAPSVESEGGAQITPASLNVKPATKNFDEVLDGLARDKTERTP